MINRFFNVVFQDYYLPIGIVLLTYFTLWVTKNRVIRRLKKISAATETYLDDVVLDALEKTRHFFIIGLSLYAGLQSLHFDQEYGHIANKAFVILVALQVIIWGREAIDSWMGLTLAKKQDDPSVKTSLGLVGLILKTIFMVTVILFALNNLGFNVSTFIAGLGVGGIAIALATQNILGDLFSSLSIVMDKPFVMGDFIGLGEWSGTIEHIGLKTTRLRSLSGEQIVIANSDLLSSKIRNYKRMAERRVVFELGVTYQTKREDLKRAPKLVEEIIMKEPVARFERAHFVRYGGSSLDIEVVYWILSPDYKIYANTHEKILFEIHEAFEANRLDFAYPTQTLFIEKKGMTTV